MMAIHLLLGLLPGESHGESVRHYDVVSRVDWARRVSKGKTGMGCEGSMGGRGTLGRWRDSLTCWIVRRLVLAHQNPGNPAREVSEHPILRRGMVPYPRECEGGLKCV
jgi:hypothetical protein